MPQDQARSPGEDRKGLLRHYGEAREWLARSRFGGELLWQDAVRPNDVTESDFLREYAWVVLNSGFREAVVRPRFDYISLCFCDWESAEAIVAAGPVCVGSAMAVFRSERKLCAVFATAIHLHQAGFAQVQTELLNDPLGVIGVLPFMGNITSRHLAKNLGFPVAKPDRHLVRVAAGYGFADVQSMCQFLHSELGERVSIVDLVLWRFAEQRARVASARAA